MLNLDPNLLDQDKLRKNKRKKLFLVSIAPLIFLTIIALFFIRTGLYNIITGISISNDSYDMVTLATNLQTYGNIIDPYLPYYNNGYFKLVQASSENDLNAAENYFNESLKNNPPESKLCAIYGNLSYTIELKANLYVNEQKYSDALVLYNKAESLLYENDCASKDSSKSGKDQMSENAKERIEKERQSAVDAANNQDPGDSNDNNDPGQQQEIDEQELEELEDIQQENIENGASQLQYLQNFNSGNNNHDFNAPNF